MVYSEFIGPALLGRWDPIALAQSLSKEVWHCGEGSMSPSSLREHLFFSRYSCAFYCIL